MNTKTNKTATSKNFSKIKGFENYAINAEGKVIVKKNNRWTLAATSIDNMGYEHITMRKKVKDSYKVKSTRVHVLVMQTYSNMKKGTKVINHKDGNKLNNHYENLEYVTQRENIQHAFKTGLMKPRTGEKRSKNVIAINFNTKEVMVFKSQRAASKHFGVSTSLVYQACKQMLPSVKGFWMKNLSV